MNIPRLALWLISAMGTFYPQQNHNWSHPAKGWYSEDPDVTEQRYEILAYDVAFAVSQPYVQPVFGDRDPTVGRAKSGLLLVSIASDETHYKEDEMYCLKGGDKGASWGPFQNQRAKMRVCGQVDSIGAAGVALEMIQESFRICRGDPLTWLSEYTDGLAYNTERAHERSARKMRRVMKYWAAHPYVDAP